MTIWIDAYEISKVHLWVSVRVILQKARPTLDVSGILLEAGGPDGIKGGKKKAGPAKWLQ